MHMSGIFFVFVFGNAPFLIRIIFPCYVLLLMFAFVLNSDYFSLLCFVVDVRFVELHINRVLNSA